MIIRDVKDRIRKSNICLLGVPEVKNRKPQEEAIFEKIIAELIPESTRKHKKHKARKYNIRQKA